MQINPGTHKTFFNNITTIALCVRIYNVHDKIIDISVKATSKLHILPISQN